MEMKMNLKSWLLTPLLALLVACGGGDDKADTPTTPPPPTSNTPTLVSIALTPANPTIAVGATQQLAATGTYSDGKSAAIKDTITWAAKGGMVTVFTSGIVTGKAIGTDTVTATVGAVVGSTTISVIGPWEVAAAGGNHTVARRKDGTLYAWGSNGWGQLGDNGNADQNKPVQVNGGVNTWRQIATGAFHTLAVRADGTLWAWGLNQNGQLGLGNTLNKAVPTQVGAAKDWDKVAAGKSHSLAISKTGVLFAWGANFNGQLGDDTTVDKLVPTKIAAPVGWKSVSAGTAHSVGVLTTDGALYAWGANESGQLGTGGLAGVKKPTRIGTESWVLATAGGNHSLAIRGDTALFAWGANDAGQLGNDSFANVTNPVRIGTDINWVNVAGGSSHSLGVKLDGTLWSWGSNSDGQLGSGTLNDRRVPVQVGTAALWSSVSAGLHHSVGVQGKDGSVWSWGRNAEGQQGNGSSAAATSPTVLP
jgi:alpha-tubulin suppressor-like RCC1 family protein